MTHHLVIGAGPTGSAVAELLAADGERVTVVSRSGRGPIHPSITLRAADATDAGVLRELAAGATTIFNCSMPRYDRWPEDFPPLSDAAIAAAQASGAGLVTISNVYLYGRAAQPFTTAMPIAPTTSKGRVRAAMWDRTLASGVRCCEIRGSDYLGRGAASLFTLMALPALRSGNPAMFPADLDAPHSWTFTRDAARTAIAAARASTAWDRAWHVPSHAAAPNELVAKLASIAGWAAPQLSRLSRAELTQLAATDSILDAVIEMLYLFEEPCLLDASDTERTLGITATPFDEVLRETLA